MLEPVHDISENEPKGVSSNQELHTVAEHSWLVLSAEDLQKQPHQHRISTQNKGETS